MNNTKAKTSRHSNLLISIVAISTVLLLGGTGPAQAQWTNGTNINNTNSGNVGIGTANPANGKLQVNKSIRIDDDSGSANGSDTLLAAPNLYLGTAQGGGAFQFNGAGGLDLWHYNNSAWSRTFTFTKTGLLGVGTTTPGEKLVTFGNMLAGNITNHTQLFSSYDSQSPVIMELGYGTATANITPFPNLVLSKNLTSANNVVGLISFANSSIANGSEKRVSGIGSWTDGATNSGALLFYTSSAGTFSERMRVTSGGNVGIGTATPTRPLEVLAADGEAARFYRNGNGVNFGVNVRFALNNSSGSEVDYAGLHGQIGSNTAGAHGGNLVFTTATGGSPTEKMRITSAGNVGIGTTSPTVKLDVNGTVNATGLTVNGLAVGGSQWATSGTAINYGTGNVGIGTTPAYTFDVRSSSTLIGRFASSASGHNQVLFDAPAGFNSNLTLQQAGSSKWYLGNRASNNRFSLIESTGMVETFSVLQNGNVGIGTIAPTAKLHVFGAGTVLQVVGDGTVTGNLTVDGNLAAKYQDVAEWVESSQALKAGTVVVLDHTRSNQVVASSQSYDTRVAGVISLQPGLSLGVPGTSKVLVATTGRVRMKVDASSGPIHIGDLLVTGDKEGVAMKSQPINIGGVQLHRPGTLIGKALESLESGTGEMLVLLSLQ